jgi:two-component system OmpR family response regulator
MSGRNILLVEDDESLGVLIKDSLDAAGWTVSRYPDGEKGLSAFLSHTYDLCVLDVMLPNRDGFDLATEIRKYNQSVPIIFLTAKSLTEDRIRGFQVGADDYVCKPFSIEEFKYRLEAVARRGDANKPSMGGILRVAQSVLDLTNLTLTSAGVMTRLTHKETQLLQLFFRHPNKLIEREVFLKAAWEDSGFFVARSMDVFVSRLRKYLSPDSHLKIENIRAVGYQMKEVDVQK